MLATIEFFFQDFWHFAGGTIWLCLIGTTLMNLKPLIQILRRS